MRGRGPDDDEERRTRRRRRVARAAAHGGERWTTCCWTRSRWRRRGRRRRRGRQRGRRAARTFHYQLEMTRVNPAYGPSVPWVKAEGHRRVHRAAARSDGVGGGHAAGRGRRVRQPEDVAFHVYTVGPGGTTKGQSPTVLLPHAPQPSLASNAPSRCRLTHAPPSTLTTCSVSTSGRPASTRRRFGARSRARSPLSCRLRRSSVASASRA